MSKPSMYDDPRSQDADRGHMMDMELGPSQSDGMGHSNDGDEPSASLYSRKTMVSQFEGKALGLDKAILHSIDCCTSDDTKKKMYSSILVVGGGLKFHKAQQFLQHRILNKMPPSFRRMVENVEVITRPKVQVFTWDVIVEVLEVLEPDVAALDVEAVAFLVGSKVIPQFPKFVVFKGILELEEFGPCRIPSLPPEPAACMERLPECREERERRRKDMDPRLIAWKGGAVLACLDTTQELWIYRREWQRFGVRMLRERAAFVW
ncbi:unnamed protein product [Ranitomeya imitator]|uniref:Actin-related protein 8 n=1 Tax=Ranitomeya imitator TaxID=111125 RepID=A0ABN9LBQ8_9NEOB|nr:unnamed protein product [Ranitomeya imitator]